jgi:hypothetical protein
VLVHSQVDQSRVDLRGAGMAVMWHRCWGNGDAGGCGGAWGERELDLWALAWPPATVTGGRRAPGAGGSATVAVDGLLQENGERRSRRMRTREGKRRDQEWGPGTFRTR